MKEIQLLTCNLRGSKWTLGQIVSDEDHMILRDLFFFLRANTEEDSTVPQCFEIKEKKYKKVLGEFLDEYCVATTEKEAKEHIYTLEIIEDIAIRIIEKGYATQDGDIVTFTPKAWEIFEKWSTYKSNRPINGCCCFNC